MVVHYIPGYNIFCSPYFNSEIVQNTQEISSVEILGFAVTKGVLMVDVAVEISSSSAKACEHKVPTASDVFSSLNVDIGNNVGGDNDKESAGGDNTVVNPWTVESDGAIDYLR